MNDHIILDAKTPVATVTFNRPSQRNAISFAMWRRFSDIMRANLLRKLSGEWEEPRRPAPVGWASPEADGCLQAEDGTGEQDEQAQG